jgi:methylthioribose-1-phosphate isomerase
MTSLPRTLEWTGNVDGYLRLLDQTLLPTQLAYRDCRNVEDVWEAIRNLRVRGAPAIGVAAAFGVVLGLQSDKSLPGLREITNYLRTSRPTAVNLFWALERMEGRATVNPNEWPQSLLDEAFAIQNEDAAMCRAIGLHGAALIQQGQGILTHCNAGALATSEYGTALAVLYTAAEQGKQFHVFADETRPLLQGARLTAWELQQAGIDVTLICDSMAAQVMREGRVQLVIVGADRIAANGDTANKIGTYGVAVLAKAHGIPFYVAAPSSTFDLTLQTGDQIPIEERDPREITDSFGKRTAPEGVRVYNPAFDVTPAELITGIVTENGLIQPVHRATIQAALL